MRTTGLVFCALLLAAPSGWAAPLTLQPLPSPAEDAATGRRLRISSYVLYAVSAASLATSFVFAGLAASKERELEEGYRDHIHLDRALEINAAGEAHEERQRVALGVGVTCAIVGVVLHALSAVYNDSAASGRGSASARALRLARFDF